MKTATSNPETKELGSVSSILWDTGDEHGWWAQCGPQVRAADLHVSPMRSVNLGPQLSVAFEFLSSLISDRVVTELKTIAGELGWFENHLC